MNWAYLSIGQATQIASWMWDALLIVWLVLWFGKKRAKKLETPWERAQHVVPILVAFWLLFESQVDNLERARVSRCPMGVVGWAGDDGSGRGNQRLGAREPGNELER